MPDDAATNTFLWRPSRRKGPCVNWEADWRTAATQFVPDAFVWSSALRDTYDVLVDGRWVTFGSPEWIALYNAQLEKAAAIATENGVPFILLSQADPKPFVDEKNEDSLTAKNIGKFADLRAIQRDFAAAHADSTILIDMNELLCPKNQCETKTPTGDPIRYDDLHFTLAGSKYMGPRLTDAIEAAMTKWYAQHPG